MLLIERRAARLPFFTSVLLLAVALSPFAASLARAGAPAQKSASAKSTSPNRTAEANKSDDATATDAPPFSEYKGVRIGMTTVEARQKLGNPSDKSDAQDFYVISDNETAQVYYDATKKVSAMAIVFVGKDANAPTAKAVLGADIEAKPDGSLHKLERYPKAGYWVSYSRTAGDAPLVSITMQKMP